MARNCDTDKLPRLLATDKGILFYHHHEGCTLDDGNRDMMEEKIAEGVMVEFKENREDGPYFIFTDIVGQEHECKMLGIMGTYLSSLDDNNYKVELLYFKAYKASSISVDTDEEPVVIAETSFPKEEGIEGVMSLSKKIVDWYFPIYREYFKEYLPNYKKA